MMIEELESRRLLSHIHQLGDADENGTINSQDFVLLSVDFGTSSPRSDFNSDGRVNALDLNVLASNFGAIEMSTTWTGLADDGNDFQTPENWSNDVPTLVNVGTAGSVGETLPLNHIPTTPFALVAAVGIVSLEGGVLAATTALSATGGGTVVNFIQLRASGQQAKYATVTGGVEQSRSQSSVFAGTISADLITAGFVLDAVYFGGQDDIATIQATGSSFSVSVPDSIGLGSTVVQLLDQTHNITISLDTITVTAGATPPVISSVSVPANGVTLSGDVLTINLTVQTEPILPASNPQGFLLSGNTQSWALDFMSGVRTSPNTYTFSLSPAVRAGDTLVLQYSEGNVEDSNHLDLDDFFDQAVTNNSTYNPSAGSATKAIFHQQQLISRKLHHARKT